MLDYNNKVMSLPNQKELDQIKKTIAKGTKYLRLYREHYLSQYKTYNTYDGGVSMFLLFFQNHYDLDFKFKEKDFQLTKITQKMHSRHKAAWFQTSEDEDIFGTPFLEDIYFQKKLRYKGSEYQIQLEKYLKSGYLNKISHMMPILDIFSQNQIKYINVALAIYGLEDRGYKISKEFRNETAKGLVAIFENQKEYDEQYLDLVKIFALYLLYLLKEDQLIDIKAINHFLKCLSKHQASNGQWIHSSNFDQVRERDNTIMSTFALGIFLEYYRSIEKTTYNFQRNKKLNLKPSKKITNDTWGSYLDTTLDKAGKLIVNLSGGNVTQEFQSEEGFANPSYPDPWKNQYRTYDPNKSWFDDVRCIPTLLTLLVYILLMVFGGYITYKFVKSK